MGTTLPNGIWLPSDDPIDWHVTPTIMGAAAAMAASGRTDNTIAPRLFRAADATEADAVKTSAVRVGDQIHRFDTDWIEELGGQGWKVVKTYRGITFTPPWNYAKHGMSYDSNTQRAWTYWVDGDQVTIQGYMGWRGSDTPTFWSSSDPVRIAVPTDLPVRYVGANLRVLGRAVCYLGGVYRLGCVAGVWGSYSDGVDLTGITYPAIFFNAGWASGNRPMGNNVPAAWTPPNATLAVNFTYTT